MKVAYRLDNGNDEVESRIGYYDESGFQDGVWRIKTPYYSALFYYDNGIIRKIIKSNTYALRVSIFDDFGAVIAHYEGTKRLQKA